MAEAGCWAFDPVSTISAGNVAKNSSSYGSMHGSLDVRVCFKLLLRLGVRYGLKQSVSSSSCQAFVRREKRRMRTISICAVLLCFAYASG